MFNNFGSGAFLSATLLKNSNAKDSVGHNHPLGGAKQVDTGGGFEYLVERLFPRHPGTGGPSQRNYRCRQAKGECDEYG